MTENKRFVTIADTDLEVSIKDNLTKRYPFSELCDDLIQFNSLLNEVTVICDEMNKLWEQTQRFEDHNKRLIEENEQLKADNNRLVNETARVVAEHQGRVFELIDEKIEELKNTNVSIISRESLEVLEQLKKELSE